MRADRRPYLPLTASSKASERGCTADKTAPDSPSGSKSVFLALKLPPDGGFVNTLYELLTFNF